ncbi:AI-2E family transporter [Pontibacter brevis]
METRAKAILIYFVLLVVGLYFFFWGLVMAKAFLAPLAVAALLAMVILPVARWFERKGLKRGWSSLFSTLLILLFFGVLAGVLSFEVKSFIEDWPKVKQQVEPKLTQLQQFIKDKTGIPVQQQTQKVSLQLPGSASGGSGDAGSAGSNQQQSQQQGQEQAQKGTQQGQASSGAKPKQGGGGSMLSSAGDFVMKFLGFLGTALLTLVYIFFFLLYRSKFRKSIAKWVPEEKRPETNKVITDAAHVSQNYLLGKLALCVLIAILYSIGLSISGVRHAILISVLAAALTLIPYLGNIIGFGLALAMAFLSGGSTTTLLGVVLTFGITQFLETYTLEPYVVGGKVNLNPIMTIIVIVLGNAVWGVVGMLIAIPALGIAKVVFDHVPALNPLGYLVGDEDMGDDDDSDSVFDKVKRWVSGK